VTTPPTDGYVAPGVNSHHVADGSDVGSTTVGELIGEVTRDLSLLMRQEVELAKAELKTEAGKTGKAAGVLGAAGFAAYMVLLFLSVALWAGLANVMDAGWAAVIVAVIWAVAGAVLARTGRAQLRHVHPKPERTVETVQQIPNALRPTSR
jgi:hypothetical protein